MSVCLSATARSRERTRELISTFHADAAPRLPRSEEARKPLQPRHPLSFGFGFINSDRDLRPLFTDKTIESRVR